MSKEKLKQITEDTVIPISLVIVIIGGVYWLTTMWYQGKANAEAIAEIKTDATKYNQNMQEVRDKLSFMEGYIKRKEENANRSSRRGF